MTGAVAQEKKIRVVVDNTALGASVQQANSLIGQIGNGTNLAGLIGAMNGATAGINAAGAAASHANDNFTSMGASAGHASGGILEMVKHLGSLTLGLAGLGALTMGVHAFAEAMVEASDHATEVTARIMSFTQSAKDAADAQAQIVSIANETRSSLPAVAELYSKIGIQGQHLGMSLGQVGLATKVFTETLKLSGSTAQQSKSAMLQLGEAYDQNTLNGRHYLAMMMDNIVFMRLLAQSMGVSMAKMKEMSTNGDITANAITKALTNPAMVAQIEKQFGRLPVSFGDVRTGIHNTLVQLAGDFASGAGINTSLGLLYARIVDFGKNSKPAFEKIGAAARAAFEAFAPFAGAALDAIKPMFSFVLNNGPELIKLLKVGAEVWIAYAAAQKAALLVGMAQKFMVEMQSLAMFLDLARGGTGVIGALKGAFLIASEGVNTFTASLLANPFTAIAVGVTAIIALLYEFRDSITLGGGSLTTFGDLMRAAWESVGPLVNTALGYVQAFSDWLNSKLGPVIDWVKQAFTEMFGGIEFGIGPALRGIGRFIDNEIMLFKYGYTAISSIWNNFPGMMAQVFAAAANFAIDKLEGLANGARSILNGIITGMNSVFHTSIGQVGEIKIPRINVPNAAAQVASDLKSVTNNRTVENAMNGLIGRADAIGAARRKAASAKPGETGVTTPHGAEAASGDDDKDGKKKAKQIADFWEALKGQLATAKLFGMELAKQTEELKLQKILGHDLSTDQKSAVDNLVEQIESAKALTSVNKAAFELRNKDTLLQARAKGLTEDQAKIEDVLDAQRLSALNAGVDINNKDYKTALDKLRAELLINQALEKQAQARKDAFEFSKRYSPAFAMQSEFADMAKQKDSFEKAFASGDALDAFGKPITQTMHDSIIKGYDQALADAKKKPFQVAIDYAKSAIQAGGTVDDRKKLITDDYHALMKNLNDAHDAGQLTGTAFDTSVQKAGEDFKRAIDDASDELGRKFTTMAGVFDKLGQALGGKAGEVASGMSSVLKSAGSFKTNSEDVSKSITDVFGSSKFASMLGSGLGKAMAGLEIGGQVGSVMTSLGIKGGETGSKIGGALGGLTGNPLIAIGGSILGGLLGSLFSHPDHSNASFTQNADGTVGVGGVGGSTGQLKQAASGAAGEVLTGLSQIASAIGGTLTGVPNLTIGTWDSKWRVLDNQRTTADLHSKNFTMGQNLHDFGSDEASAVSYAIGEALKQGVITGLSDLAQKALSALDSDSAISFIQSWTKVLSDYKAIIDPVGSAVSGVIDPLKTLLDTMNKVGASSDDLTKLYNYQTLALKKALDAQLSTLNSLMKTLNGDGSGRTALDRLTDDLAEFNDYKTRIAAGDTSIDQSAFSSLASEIQSLTGSVYGTSTQQGQDILSSLKDATSSLIGSITTKFNADAGYDVNAAAAPITASLSTQTAQIVITNSLLQQIVNNTSGSSSNASGGSNDNDVTANALLAKNGEYLGLSY